MARDTPHLPSLGSSSKYSLDLKGKTKQAVDVGSAAHVDVIAKLENITRGMMVVDGRYFYIALEWWF